jgi:hypothetical protein
VRAFCALTSVASTGGCATAQPIALTAITDIPTATAVLMTNRVMLLFRMIAPSMNAIAADYRRRRPPDVMAITTSANSVS